jgi:hypothetical protein
VKPKVKIVLDDNVVLDHKSYTYFGLSVRSHTNIAVSWTCHQMEGDSNTQNHENAGIQDTTTRWQVTNIHRIMRTFVFKYNILM